MTFSVREVPISMEDVSTVFNPVIDRKLSRLEPKVVDVFKTIMIPFKHKYVFRRNEASID